MAARKAPAPTKKAAAQEPPASQARPAPADNVDLLDDLPLLLTVELGRTRTPLAQAVAMGEHSLIELDKQGGDPVELRLNGVLFARGEVVTVSENFGVRITEIVGKA